MVIGRSMKEGERSIPAFEDSFVENDNTRYLTYLPFAGISNQFYGMIRSMEVARALNRTLILPPITTSIHDKSGQNQPWSKFLDLDRLMDLQQTKVTELHQLRDQHRAEHEVLQCQVTCGFGSRRDVDHTAQKFLDQWKFNLTTSLFLDDNDEDKKLETIVQGLLEKPLRDRKFICISNGFRIVVDGRKEWSHFGQHLHFTKELESFVQHILDKILKNNEDDDGDDDGDKNDDARTVVGSLKSTAPRRHRYIVVHARRGDFLTYCVNRFTDEELEQCQPSTEALAARVSREQARLNPSLDPFKNLPVLVTTNEMRENELQHFADLGWLLLDHDRLGTVEALGVFGPMMADQVLLAHAEVLISSRFSTFSRTGAQRQRDWHGHAVEYM
ncbi:hypothetical protein EC968_008616 [Mortierella alpina]|nr:hypothetical protein EC968_008616 [Mortierella alpina]